MSVHEPPPQKSDHPAIYDLIYADLEERDQYGKDKYGVRLQPFNGRNAAVDAYQEVMDLLVYQRQMIYEYEKVHTENVELRATVKQLRDGWHLADKQLCSQQDILYKIDFVLKEIRRREPPLDRDDPLSHDLYEIKQLVRKAIK